MRNVEDWQDGDIIRMIETGVEAPYTLAWRGQVIAQFAIWTNHKYTRAEMDESLDRRLSRKFEWVRRP